LGLSAKGAAPFAATIASQATMPSANLGVFNGHGGFAFPRRRAGTPNGALRDDTLVGPADADLFVFDLECGRDAISDFETGIDEIDVSAHGCVDYAAILAITTDIGDRAEVALKGATDVIARFRVAEAALAAGDFGFA